MEWVLLWLISAIVAATIASSKGRSAFGWFVLGCLISIFAVLFVAVLPSRKTAPTLVGGEVVTPQTHTRCPACKGHVHREATVCMHCKGPLLPRPASPGNV